MFRLLYFKPNKSTVRLFYDILHGIKHYGVNIKDALELGILIGIDGQLSQDSKIEKSILDVMITGLHDRHDNGKERALAWLYVKSWNAYGDHIIRCEELVSGWVRSMELWTFEKKDLDAALVKMLYPTKEDAQVQELKEMILERFDNDSNKYFEWSLKIRDEMVSPVVYKVLLKTIYLKRIKEPKKEPEVYVSPSYDGYNSDY